MKNVSRNKCLLCFKPVVNVDLMLESESEIVIVNRARNRRVVTNVTDTNININNNIENRSKEGSRPSMTNSSISDAENPITIHRGGKKTFSQAIKAVVFETILAKRVRDRNRGDESRSKRIQGTISSRSSSLSSSTQDLTQEAETKQNSEEGETKPKQEGTDHEGSSSSKTATCLLLIISLAMIIFSGKSCAIIFTSIFLYFLPRQRKRASGVDGEMESIEIEKDSRD